MIRVGVIGAGGKMGSEVCRAVREDSSLELAAAVDSDSTNAVIEGVQVHGEFDALTAADVEVAVDFTHPSAVFENALWCLSAGIHVVVGTTGLAEEQLVKIGEAAIEGEANAFVAPNFAVGAVLMMHFAASAARHFERAEIIELHHDQKADAPSGTALRTAALMNAERGEWPDRGDSVEVIEGARGALVDGVRIHSVRLPGLVAHQEVVLGASGQTLSIRHDSIDRAGFMPGVLLAIKAVGSRRGLTVGLEELLGL